MSIEIKFVLFTFFISFFQLVLLYAFGNIKYKSDPKNNFLVSTVIVFVVLYSVYLYLGNISIKTLLGSILFLSSSVIILFTFWTILIWGFTISLLESLTKLKVSNKEKWIKKYGINFGTKPEDWIDNDLTKQDMAPFIKNKYLKN